MQVVQVKGQANLTPGEAPVWSHGKEGGAADCCPSVRAQECDPVRLQWPANMLATQR